MANANKPFGFKPVGYLNGAPWNGKGRVYSIAASYDQLLYIGDPVISSGTADGNGVPGVLIGGATGVLRGSIMAIGRYEHLLADPANLDKLYHTANDAAGMYCLVADDPATIFEIQEEGGLATQLAATDVGANTVPVSGTGNGYLSGWLLAGYTTAAPTTTATLQLKLLGLARRPGNVFGAYAKWLVSINVHELGHGTGAVGI